MNIEELLKTLQDEAGPGHTDLPKPRIRERMVLEKFDKTDVHTPGVEGLEPIETIVMEDGVIVGRWKSARE